MFAFCSQNDYYSCEDAPSSMSLHRGGSENPHSNVPSHPTPFFYLTYPRLRCIPEQEVNMLSTLLITIGSLLVVLVALVVLDFYVGLWWFVQQVICDKEKQWWWKSWKFGRKHGPYATSQEAVHHMMNR